MISRDLRLALRTAQVAAPCPPIHSDPLPIHSRHPLPSHSQELAGPCEGSWNRPLAHAPVCAANERRVALALRDRLQRQLDGEYPSLEQASTP